MNLEGEGRFNKESQDRDSSNDVETSDTEFFESMKESAPHWSVMVKADQQPPIEILANGVSHGIKTRKRLESEGVEAGGWGLQGENNISVLPDNSSSYYLEGMLTDSYPTATVIIDPDFVSHRISSADYIGTAAHLGEKIAAGRTKAYVTKRSALDTIVDCRIFPPKVEMSHNEPENP